MKAQLIKATVNGQTKWRVYYHQEIVAQFEIESLARLCVIYLNKRKK